MHDATHLIGMFLAQHQKRPLKELTAVDQYRQSQHDRQPELCPEDGLLYIQWHAIDRIKSDFSDGDTERRSFRQLFHDLLVNNRGMHGVDTIGRQNPGVFSRQRRHPLPAVGVHPGNDKGFNPDLASLLQDLRQMRNQGFQIEMAMAVDHAFAFFGLQIWLFGIHCHPTMNSTIPDITIIVPILNDVGELPGLITSLVEQDGIALELIFCDGGSHDGSQKIVSQLGTGCRFPVRLIQAACGRGSQMNAGAASAGADLLLFLHADSRFEEHDAISTAIAFYRRQTMTGSRLFAARFGLHFRRSSTTPSLPYFFYEAKSHLSRHDCIRGDQGFLLNRDTFAQLGGFDESLPFLEDIRLAATIARHSEWHLLPATISSSARRFETEGLKERQILNAIIVNNALAGWSGFFTSLPGLYRTHAASGRLQLFPILDGIRTLLEQSSTGWRRSFWQTTGRHVAGNAWQLFYWLDVRTAFANGKSPGEVQPRCLNFYLQRLEPFFKTRCATFMAQSAVRLWLRWMLFNKH